MSLKVFGEGAGPECRKICQALNATRGRLQEEKFIAETEKLYSESQSYFESQEDSKTVEGEESVKQLTSSVAFVPVSRSKWAKYSDEGSSSENGFLFK